MAEIEETEGIASFLTSLGATDAQIEAARAERRLPGLAAELVLTEGATLSATDLAERAGVSVAEVVGIWRMLGVILPDVDQPMFTERDANFTVRSVHINPVGDQGVEFFRVVGSSLARIAEAAVSMYVQNVEPQLDSPDVDVAVWARDLANTTAMALKIGDSMGAIFTHHMRDAIDRQRVAQVDMPDRTLSQFAVGFVDLVGFTPLALHKAPSELLEVISLFGARAFDVASTHRGRIVKHIGDEVMFVALDPSAACAIAMDLVDAYAGGIDPRGGVAFGEVITRHGDYYGAIVNLASRLADLAIPREVLVDQATASAADRFSFRPAGTRQLKGFDEPIEVFSLHSCAPRPPGG